MTELREFNRVDWLALRPEIYLADGYLDAAGVVRQDFMSDYATAAATQLLAAEVSPQELALTVEGIRQILPLHDGAPSERAFASLAESLAVVARAIQQTNNGGLVDWLNACAEAVATQEELDGFILHIAAVVRLYGVLAGLQPDSSALPH